jgi:DNA-binding NarL/FixJ family response regulator
LEVRTQENGRRNRTELNSEWFSIRPYALAGHPRELHVAVVCILLLAAVLVGEILTPDTIVSAIAILPLLAGLWVLSNRSAAVVAIAATVFLVVAVVLEDTDRTTMILLGVVIFITGVVVRLQAAALASALSKGRRKPSTGTAWAAPTSVTAEQSPLELRALTRRELEVARLAAEGLTAAQIGRRLFIGDRTVESHLAGAYSKLGINSRLQLIRMADRLGAPPA